MATLKSFMRAVEQKLDNPKVKQMLQFGQTYTNKVAPIRDTTGMAMTRETIMQTAQNAWTIMDGKVGLDHMFQNFSAGATHADVADVRTIGAIDLTILAMSQSLVPFVCVDRGMATPESTIYFNNLVASNSAGNVSNGEVVIGNFTPPNTNMYLGASKSEDNVDEEGAVSSSIILGNNIIQGSVTVVVKDAAGKQIAIGKDFNGATDAEGKVGEIYFKVAPKATNPVTATVEYSSGTVTLEGTLTGVTVEAKGSVDPTADAAGEAVLTVKPEWKAVQLISEPMNIILQNNIANMMYMQKTYALASGSTAQPYNDLLFQRVKNAYIESINSMIIRKALRSAMTTQQLQINLTGYGTESYAQTKNDLVCQLVSSMKATLLGRTGVGLSALLVNSNAAALLEQVPVQFVPNPQIGQGINGIIGYFSGIPVFRHNSLDKSWGGYVPGTDGIMLGVYRSADNMSGSQVFGEFIPFTSTGNVMNYAQPTQNSTGYFSQVGSQIVQDNLVIMGRIKLNNGSEDGNILFTDFSL